MTRSLFDEKYPRILGWIKQTSASHRSEAQPVGRLGFKRLPQYFSSELLSAAQVVYVREVPMPPLKVLGLGEFSEFEDLNPAGITYLDTFFSRDEMRGNEAHHFHELVHVVQWRLLGPRSFLAAYAEGLARFGYRESPLEVMAYTLERRFCEATLPFGAESLIREQLPSFLANCEQ